VGGLTLFAALLVVPSAVAPAWAQTAGDVSCTFEVSPSVLPQNGGVVTVTGHAPGTSVVQIFFDPVGPTPVYVAVADVPTTPIDGFFEASFFTSVTGEATVGVNDYPGTPCFGVGAGGGGPGGAGARRGGAGLARTGSSQTVPFAYAGVGLVAIGLALVVATRRLGSIRGRG
jgi:LPXTG-motif cell wall-anchored protein